MKLIGFIIPFALFTVHINAQLWSEVSAYQEQINIQNYWDKPLDSNKRFSLFLFNQISQHYFNHDKTGYFLQAFGLYNFNKNVGVGLGANFDNGKFIPAVSGQFQLERNDLYFCFFPSIELTQKTGFDIFSLAQYNPKISQKLNFYSLGFMGVNFQETNYNYSYQWLRLGIEFRKSKVQTGMAFNFDQEKSIAGTINLGVFIRKEF